MQQTPNESTESTEGNIHANIPVFSHYTHDKINIIYAK